MSQHDYAELRDKGILRKECLKLLYPSGPEWLPVELIQAFMVRFGLATEIKREASLFIPSLIPDFNREHINQILKNIKKDPNTRGIYFSINKSNQLYTVFNQILSHLLSREDLIAIFEKAFAAKIENREVGMVAAMSGKLKWDGEDVVDFVLTERDRDDYADDPTFGRHRVSA